MTTKLGSSDKRPGTQATQPSPVLRFYASEMMMSLFVLTAALYGIFSVNKWSFSIFLTLQGTQQPSLPRHCSLKVPAFGHAPRPFSAVLQLCMAQEMVQEGRSSLGTLTEVTRALLIDCRGILHHSARASIADFSSTCRTCLLRLCLQHGRLRRPAGRPSGQQHQHARSFPEEGQGRQPLSTNDGLCNHLHIDRALCKVSTLPQRGVCGCIISFSAVLLPQLQATLP